jgi:kynurenine formamidase
MLGYRIVDLSLPIVDGGGFFMPARITYLDHRSRGRLVAERAGLDPDDLGGRANAIEEFHFLTSHTGTHMDAPWHYAETAAGSPALTIDQVPLEWCMGDGVWLDLGGRRPGDEIAEADLRQALQRIGYTLKPWDIVLIRTGAAAHYGEPGCDRANPGMSAGATAWLGRQGVRVVGIDAGIWDRPAELQLADLRDGRSHGCYMQAHRAAGEYGMCILEWLTNLERLPHTGFLVFAFPVKVHRAGGAWVRAAALVKDAEVAP